MRPDVSICILTWNRADFLEVCLRELFASITPTELGGLSREILIMDNGSTDKTHEILLQYENRPGVRVFRQNRNIGFAAYKRLFFHARGRVVIDLDDDILKFPKDFDKTLVDYLSVYKDYGFLACNVVQNEMTDGNRPRNVEYIKDIRGEMVVEEGPTGGWCSAFRRRDYLWIKLLVFLFRMDAKTPEDAYIASLCWRLRKRIGIITNTVVFHACGPAYAREYNHLDREIEKYCFGGNLVFAQKFIEEKQSAENK